MKNIMLTVVNGHCEVGACRSIDDTEAVTFAFIDLGNGIRSKRSTIVTAGTVEQATVRYTGARG